MNRRVATALLIGLLATSAVAPATATTSTAEASGYSGAHVSFDVQSNAIADYAVEGTTVLDSVRVQSQESSESGGLVDAGASLSAVTSLDGAGLSLSSQTTASATVSASRSSRAEMTAHDNPHGILVVSSEGESQYVVANVSSSAEATAESDSQVTVSTEGDTEGTFIVVGDGSVTVNDEGDVSAKLGEDAKLVFRAYPNDKNEEDDKQEQLIADGSVAGEAYVMSQEGDDHVVDTVTYTQDTTVDAEQSAQNTVSVTVDRAASEGKVVITSVSEQAVGTLESLSVTVDGEAAARVSSYSALTGAIGSDRSAYTVRQSSSANARADVLVAFNHFSERTATISGGDSDTGDSDTTTTASDAGGDDGSDGDDGSGGDSGTSASSPGFGALAALVAFAAVALVARVR